MNIDGRTIARPLSRSADVVVIGSGPAGSAAAREASRLGARVIVVEAGLWHAPTDFPLSAFDAMRAMYRDMGASVMLGPSPIPYLQGRMVGGSAPINGAICWRLPRDVHEAWCAADPALRQALDWEIIEAVTDEIEARIGVAPTPPHLAGTKNLLMARGAEALGLEHRPIRRNVRGCEGLGRCLQGCPKGAKQSPDITLLADAVERDAIVISATEVDAIEVRAGRAWRVVGTAQGGGAVSIEARKAVIVAASAIQTPHLLLASGINHGPVGHNLQCHPGVSMAGRFTEPVRMWEGATQGHEVIGLRAEGLKFEALGFGLAILGARMHGLGGPLSQELAQMAHWADWGVAVRAQGRGRVRRLGRTGPIVTWSPTAEDLGRFRRGLAVLGALFFAAGAREVLPGVKGFAPRVERPEVIAAIEREGPRSARAFTSAVTHMFGTCRMGSDPASSVVRPDFRHHALEGLYLADSSVFPTNLGVNPQVPIMALATLCARRAMGA